MHVFGTNTAVIQNDYVHIFNLTFIIDLHLEYQTLSWVWFLFLIVK